MSDRPNGRWFRLESGGDDSPDPIEVIMKLEQEFDIVIPDEDAEKITTVADAIRYIEERRGGNSTTAGEP